MTSLPSIGASDEYSGTVWYALHVRCNQEHAVARGLSCRGIPHFLPSYDSLRQWKDRRIKLQMPLFPGYLFVRIPLRDRMLVVTVPNVVALVGCGAAPHPFRKSKSTGSSAASNMVTHCRTSGSQSAARY